MSTKDVDVSLVSHFTNFTKFLLPVNVRYTALDLIGHVIHSPTKYSLVVRSFCDEDFCIFKTSPSSCGLASCEIKFILYLLFS